jgi:soluble lytic murein transglycosylase-like protein
MRACILALAVTAVAQPALAREHHKSSHASSHHHHYAGPARHHFARFHHRIRFARIQREPVISGYAMPQSFARTDSTDSAWRQTQAAQSWQQAAMPSTSFDPAMTTLPVRARARAHDAALDSMIARHAAANGLPVELVRRVVARESGFNPRASHAGNIGLMQIRYATARSMGYTGSAAGLLDPETNLTYATRYLAGAYRAAGGSHGRAVAFYASGYHGRGVAVARRAAPAMVAEATSVASPSGFAMPNGMQSEVVMARRHFRRHRAH